MNFFRIIVLFNGIQIQIPDPDPDPQHWLLGMYTYNANCDPL